MEAELETKGAVLRRNLGAGLLRPFSGLRRAFGNMPLAARLYALAALLLSVCAIVVTVLIVGEATLQSESAREHRAFSYLIDSSSLIWPDPAQWKIIMAARQQISPDEQARHDRDIWSNLDRNQRQILKAAKRQLATSAVTSLEARMDALRQAMERHISVDLSQRKIVALIQSAFNESVAARQDERFSRALSARAYQAELELGAIFDALVLAASTHSAAVGEQGVTRRIKMLETHAQRYTRAHERTESLMTQPGAKQRLYRLYGDPVEMGDLAAQFAVLARAQVAAARDYALAYETVHELLVELELNASAVAETNVPATIGQKLAKNRDTLAITILIGVAFICIATFVTIRRMKRAPMPSDDDTMTQLSGGEAAHSAPQSETGEADSIATAFQQMTDRLEDVTLTVNYLGDIISSLSIGLLVIDENGRVRMANPAFRTMAGFAQEGEAEDQLIGTPMETLFRQERRKKHRLQEVRGKGIETTLVSSNGNTLPVMLVSTPLPSHDPIKGMVCATIDLSERKMAEEHVRAGRERIESLVQHLHEIQEMERSRIARDLHDDLGAVLTALRNGLVRLCGLVGSDAGAAANDLVELADKANTSVDRVIKNLWPQMLDHFGLGGALEALAAEFEHTHGVVTKCNIDTGQTRFDRRVELALYRTAQEALTNIAKHAHARNAHVSLVNRGFETVLEISDDGHGFVKRDRNDREGGYGLLGMRQRVAAVSGDISVETGVKGSKVTVRVPLTPDKSEAMAAVLPNGVEGQIDDKSSAG